MSGAVIHRGSACDGRVRVLLMALLIWHGRRLQFSPRPSLKAARLARPALRARMAIHLEQRQAPAETAAQRQRPPTLPPIRPTRPPLTAAPAALVEKAETAPQGWRERRRRGAGGGRNRDCIDEHQ